MSKIQNVPDGRFYTRDHEWALVSSDEEQTFTVQVGITDYAQSELGDVVFVDLPQVGTSVEKGDVLLSVESVKAVSDVYAPFSGEVIGVNEELASQPELVNSDAYDTGWMVSMSVARDRGCAQQKELLSASAYREFVSEQSK